MNYHDISHDDMNNGEGLRVVLWLSGCNHRCYNCQNPQTWNSQSGILFDESAKEELFSELRKDYTSGITLSGGDPLYEENLKDVLDLVSEIRLLMPEKSIWIYSGFTWEETRLHELMRQIIDQCNIMVDGRFVDSLKDLSLKWKGSSNQRVIDVHKTLTQERVILY